MSFLRSGFSAGLLLLVAAASLDARAQSSSLTAAASAVRADVRERVTLSDTLLEFRTRRTPVGRVDVESGVLRAEYRIRERVARAESPAETARSYLRSRAEAYGVTPDLSDLHVEQTRSTGHATHVIFQQMHAGVPVLRRQIKVSLDRDGHPSMVVSAYAPHLGSATGFSPNPVILASEAASVARDALTAPAEASEPALVVLAEKRPRLVWRVIAWPMSGGEWEVLVDARSGEIVSLRDQAIHDRFGSAAGMATAPNLLREAALSVTAVEPAALVDGSGLVFIPDPVTRAGVTYGGSFVDADDADLPELNGQRSEVLLPDVTRGTDGLYRLSGPLVEIVGTGVGQSYEPPAVPEVSGFQFTRSDPRFEAVMAYYHVDASQRYVDALNAGTPPAQRVAVNPHGSTSDNSQYYPFQHAISFGSGGIDDAEDATVIRHEHAHAILNNTTPGLLSTTEGQRFHEGWADYWAVSYLRFLVESGEVPPRDWTHLFPWDGNNGNWCGRYLNHPGHFPDQMEVEPPSGCGAYPTLYQHGLLWATTLMEVYGDLDREVTDRLNLASHAYLNTPVTLADAAEALIQADVDLYGGIHTGDLIARLGARGFVDAAAYGPLLTHEPLSNTETIGGTMPIEVMATGSTAEIDSVIVYYGTAQIPFEALVLEPVGEGTFVGELPLPTEPDTLRYYIEAVDVLRRRSFLPEDGAEGAFTVAVGPDLTPPTITHTPILSSSLAAWPALVTAMVDDALGVDTVWVDFFAHDSLGNQVAEGKFGLVDSLGIYLAPFPVDVALLGPRSRIIYRIHAYDASRSQNVSFAPASSYYSFRIVVEGVLQAYDFERRDPEITATGTWEQGDADFGVRTAHSGTYVWATNLTGPYPASPQLSTLELPPLNLVALGQAYLVFWHWYDFEHNGQAVPDSSKQVPLWDGGNVKISLDGGHAWTVATPEGGYPGIIDQGLENPLGGEPAFGGYSYGWRRVVVPLPTEPGVRIRFDFGTDLSNQDASVAYAGWYLDDVSIATVVPPDVSPPLVVAHHQPEMLRAPGQQLPIAAITVMDDVGVSVAEVRYEFYPASGTPVEGSFRLAMADTSLHYLSAPFPLARSFEPGDRIDFRFLIRDFGGNEVEVPAGSEPSFRIQYRNLGRTELLSGAHPSGLWSVSGAGWQISQGPHVPRSGLVLDRVDLPENAEDLFLEIRHQYDLQPGAGGNVKVTADGGASWMVVTPEAGYPDELSVAPPHPMAGQPVFAGAPEVSVSSQFDLSQFAGQQVQIRLDLGLARPLRVAESWTIENVALISGTEDPVFNVPRALALHPNFPDPFPNSTSISYTIPEPAHVTLEVFDLLGRRVALLVDSRQEAGTYTSDFSAASLASGMYLLRLRAGSAQRVEHMMVAR